MHQRVVDYILNGTKIVMLLSVEHISQGTPFLNNSWRSQYWEDMDDYQLVPCSVDKLKCLLLCEVLSCPWASIHILLFLQFSTYSNQTDMIKYTYRQCFFHVQPSPYFLTFLLTSDLYWGGRGGTWSTWGEHRWTLF